MPDFSPSEQIFSNFFSALSFLATPHLLPKTAEQNSADKQKKKQARIFRAQKHEVHIFSADSIFAPGVSQPISSRYSSLQSKSQPSDRQRLPFRHQPANIFSRSPPPASIFTPDAAANSLIAKLFFCSFGFLNAKTRGVHFSASSRQASCSRLDRPTSFCRASLQSITLPAANISPSGTSRPIPPAAIFSYQPHNLPPASLLPSGLAGRRLTHLQPPPPTPSSQPFSSLFYRQHSPGFHSSSIFPFLTSPSNLLPVFSPHAIHFLRPAAASPTRRPNAKCSFARGCSLQGCRGCGRGALVFSFSFLSLAPRLRRDASSFLFIFVLLFSFLFYFFLSFFFFFCLSFLFFLLPLFFFFLFSLLSPIYFMFISSLRLLFFFFSSYFFCLLLPIQYFLAFFFLSLFFLLLLFYLSCLQSISCSPFLPVLFFFFLLSSLQPLSCSPPTIRQSFIFFFYFFFSFLSTPPYSPVLFNLPSVSHFFFFFLLFFSFLHHHPHFLPFTSGSRKKKKKNRQKNFLGESDLPVASGRREERQMGGRSPGVEETEGVRKRCILCWKE